jgi:predicted NBD/HSP70 family sugar kinase
MQEVIDEHSGKFEPREERGQKSSSLVLVSETTTGYRVDPPASSGAVFSLIRQGIAQTRRDISRFTSLAPSTVSLRVEALIDEGLIEEAEREGSTGGRQPRVLRVRGEAGTVASAALGARHFTLALADMVGRPIDVTEVPIDVASGPTVIVDKIWSSVEAALARCGLAPSSLRGIALGVPAPVDSRLGTVSSSAQLPGWDHLDLYALLRGHTPTPAVIENDANLLAMAEHRLAGPAVENMLAVKVGGRIGSGIIAGGHLYTGASGAAGEISHSATDGVSFIHCSCGTENCLESVASGSAIIARLRGEGFDITTTADLIALSSAGTPAAIEALRDSGKRVGEVLAEVVNFLNPNLVVFGGSLSAADAFVAAVRGTVFQRCLPIVTAGLEVKVGLAGPDAEAQGGINLILERILTPEAIDRAIAQSRQAVA